MKPKKFMTSYVESDLATMIHDYVCTLQSPEGAKFSARHVDEGTIIVNVYNQTFVINVMEKSSLS